MEKKIALLCIAILINFGIKSQTTGIQHLRIAETKRTNTNVSSDLKVASTATCYIVGFYVMFKNISNG